MCPLTVCLRVCSYSKALMFLVYSYQYNKELLSGGLYRGHHQELIGCYRRACLLVRQEQTTALVSGCSRRSEEYLLPPPRS